MDSFEINKIIGAILLVALLVIGIGKISDLVFNVNKPNALKNIIINSNQINENSNIAYFCGDNVSYELDLELKKEGFKIKKIINYLSEKITDLSQENKTIIENHPPDIILVYSSRSASSFIKIIKNFSLYPLMTQSKVMCISKKVADIFTKNGWKKVETFNPGEEIFKIEENK